MALLLAAREAFVDTALGERRVDVEVFHRGLDLFDPVPQLRRLTAHGGGRGAQEVRHRHAGHLDRVLHGEEQAGASALVDAHLQHVLAVERDRARRHRVLRVTGDRVRQRRLSGPVGTHQCMCLPRLHGESDALEDRDLRPVLVRNDADVQVLDFQCGHEVAVLDSVIASSCSMASVRRSRTAGTAILAMISPKKPRTTRRRAWSSGMPRACR